MELIGEVLKKKHIWKFPFSSVLLHLFSTLIQPSDDPTQKRSIAFFGRKKLKTGGLIQIQIAEHLKNTLYLFIESQNHPQKTPRR